MCWLFLSPPVKPETQYMFCNDFGSKMICMFPLLVVWCEQSSQWIRNMFISEYLISCSCWKHVSKFKDFRDSLRHPDYQYWVQTKTQTFTCVSRLWCLFIPVYGVPIGSLTSTVHHSSPFPLSLPTPPNKAMTSSACTAICKGEWPGTDVWGGWLVVATAQRNRRVLKQVGLSLKNKHVIQFI